MLGGLVWSKTNKTCLYEMTLLNMTYICRTMPTYFGNDLHLLDMTYICWTWHIFWKWFTFAGHGLHLLNMAYFSGNDLHFLVLAYICWMRPTFAERGLHLLKVQMVSGMCECVKFAVLKMRRIHEVFFMFEYFSRVWV